MARPRRSRGADTRGFLKNDMRIGATYAKGANSGPAGRPAPFPFGKRRIDVKGTIREIDLRISLSEMQTGWQQFVFEREDALDYACNTGCRIQMSNISLY